MEHSIKAIFDGIVKKYIFNSIDISEEYKVYEILNQGLTLSIDITYTQSEILKLLNENLSKDWMTKLIKKYII